MKVLNLSNKELKKYDAISGPQDNGLLPNGKYRVGKKRTVDFNIDGIKGTYFRFDLYPLDKWEKGHTGEGLRNALMIHGCWSPEKYQENNWADQEFTQGCISVYHDYLVLLYLF